MILEIFLIIKHIKNYITDFNHIHSQDQITNLTNNLLLKSNTNHNHNLKDL
jgi:hypothetical protein